MVVIKQHRYTGFHDEFGKALCEGDRVEYKLMNLGRLCDIEEHIIEWDERSRGYYVGYKSLLDLYIKEVFPVIKEIKFLKGD